MLKAEQTRKSWTFERGTVDGRRQDLKLKLMLDQDKEAGLLLNKSPS